MLLYFLISLRLHFRNKLALLYSYLFPTLFLIAFWVLYLSAAPASACRPRWSARESVVCGDVTVSLRCRLAHSSE
jgi:hypothetical protein